jgi:hypothetical protein
VNGVAHGKMTIETTTGFSRLISKGEPNHREAAGRWWGRAGHVDDPRKGADQSCKFVFPATGPWAYVPLGDTPMTIFSWKMLTL